MNRNEYMKEIQRTWTADEITWREQICNATLGLVGEIREYIYAFEGNELGDCLYYAHTILRLLEHEHKLDGWPPKTMIARDRLQDVVAEIAEGLKKVAFHGREELTNSVAFSVGAMIRTLEVRADRYGGAEAVRAANIAKLRGRYPKGFVMGGGKR